MKPVSPVIPGCELPEVKYAEHQEEYLTLPAYKYNDTEQTILCRWRMNWKERISALVHGDIYVWVLTFGRRLQPMSLSPYNPKVTKEHK